MSNLKNGLLDIFTNILIEQKEYKDFDSVWDYKSKNNHWYTRRKSKPDSKWIDISNIPAAVKKLNAKYGGKTRPQVPPLKPSTPSDFIKPSPITADQTNVQQHIPTYDFQKDAPKPKPQPKEVIKKEVEPTNTVGSDTVSSKFNGKINFDKLPTDKETEYICNPGTKECAQFVNDYSDKISTVGDAWHAHDTDAVGKTIFSVYYKLPRDIINRYYEIFKKVKGGATEDIVGPDIKKLQTDIIKKHKQPSKLKVDDVVGIFNENSTHQKDAFIGSATFGKGYYPKDRMGRTLRSGRGHSLNTHVGIVGAIKDGVPLIFHNVMGNVKSTPANQLPIVWVKRNA